MRKISRSALVPFTAAQMYSLAEDVESYPKFLPWCSGVKVHSRDSDEVVATLDLQRGAMRKSFTTRNPLVPGESIGLTLEDGPFRHLLGGWTFKQLGDSGCKVSFELEFEFSNPVSDLLFASFFEETCDSLVDKFTDRAAEVYGSES